MSAPWDAVFSILNYIPLGCFWSTPGLHACVFGLVSVHSPLGNVPIVYLKNPMEIRVLKAIAVTAWDAPLHDGFCEGLEWRQSDPSDSQPSTLAIATSCYPTTSRIHLCMYMCMCICTYIYVLLHFRMHTTCSITGQKSESLLARKRPSLRRNALARAPARRARVYRVEL